jgi:tetratricopeptide (TPR) repeat protein
LAITGWSIRLGELSVSCPSDEGVFGRVRPVMPEISPAATDLLWTVPPAPVTFTDRAGLLSLVLSLAESERDGPAICAIHGSSGSGKTVSLFRCAAEVADLFDCAVHLDFQGPDGGGRARLDDAVVELIETLQGHSEAMPTTSTGRLNRYRAMTRGRRVLLLLDGVTDWAQVQTLLPNSSRALVIAAGEAQLDGSAAYGAKFFHLSGLDPENGVQLLTKICVDRPVRSEPDHLRRLVELVDGSPGGIGLIAGRLRSHHGSSVAHLVDELERELAELPLLENSDEPQESNSAPNTARKLIAVTDSAYRRLPSDTAAVFHILGHLPGRRWPKRVVAAALRTSVTETAAHLNALVDADLLELHGDDEYSMASLPRRYARRAGSSAVNAVVLDAAVALAMTAWVDDAIAADFAINEDRLRIDQPEPGPQVREFGSQREAVEYLARCHDDLLEVARRAAAQGMNQPQGVNSLVWRLFQAMWPFYTDHPLTQAWRELADLAVAAAEADNNIRVLARMLCQRSRAHLESGDPAAAKADIDRALQLSKSEGGALYASALDFSGHWLYRQGLYAEALVEFEAALGINEQLGDRRGIGLQSQFRGRCLGKLGRGAEALNDFTRAHRELEISGDFRALSRIACSRAEVLIAQGDDSGAAQSLNDALEYAGRLGKTLLFTRPLELLIEIARGHGEAEAEREYLKEIIALHRNSGLPRLDQWQTRLAELSE